MGGTVWPVSATHGSPPLASSGWLLQWTKRYTGLSQKPCSVIANEVKQSINI
ncbi:MAG: hypothetical protein LBJ47_06705 [Tannerella sp.]|nr:hypothetical protein [Tannerella sp.]